jgi:hypothetical protein
MLSRDVKYTGHLAVIKKKKKKMIAIAVVLKYFVRRDSWLFYFLFFIFIDEQEQITNKITCTKTKKYKIQNSKVKKENSILKSNINITVHNNEE